MADIKLGYGCGIKATLLMPTGVVCDLRDALFVNAVLALPNGSSMYAQDIAVDRVTNAIYVRLLADRELTAEGNYRILFNVKLVDGVMYSTVAVNFANVTTNADAEYKEIVLSSNLEVTDNPHNVQRTGASPKVSPRQTWLVYNDEAKAYEDTGIPAEVNLGDYYTKEEADAKVAELESEVIIKTSNMRYKGTYYDTAYWTIGKQIDKDGNLKSFASANSDYIAVKANDIVEIRSIVVLSAANKVAFTDKNFKVVALYEIGTGAEYSFVAQEDGFCFFTVSTTMETSIFLLSPTTQQITDSLVRINELERNTMPNKGTLSNLDLWQPSTYYSKDGVKTELGSDSFRTTELQLKPNTLYHLHFYLRNETMSLPLLDENKHIVEILMPSPKSEGYYDLWYYNNKHSYIGFSSPKNDVSLGKTYYEIWDNIISQALAPVQRMRERINIADIIPMSSKRVVKIGFLGDSTTDGNGTTDGGTHESFDNANGGIGAAKYINQYAYPAILQSFLRRESGNDNIECYNIGYSGTNTFWAYNRIDAILGGAYSDVDVLCISYGINDRILYSNAEDYRAGFKYYTSKIIEYCISKGITPILLTTQPTSEIGVSSSYNLRFGRYINIVANEVKKKLAEIYNLELIDLNSFLADLIARQEISVSDYMPDKLHFNDKGHLLEGMFYASQFIKRTWNVDALSKIGYLNDNVRCDLPIEDMKADAEWGYIVTSSSAQDKIIYDINILITKSASFKFEYNGDIHAYINDERINMASQLDLKSGYYHIRLVANTNAITFKGLSKL